VNTSNEKLESNSSAESEKKGRYGIIVTDYSCDGGHWKWNRIPERDREEGNKGFRARRSERLKGFNLL
jgi:hypothetical protein